MSPLILDVDWVKRGYVTNIKDQGSCGGCYSFTAMDTIESAYLIKDKRQYKDAIDLSEQQLVDCSGNFGNKGCNGGWMSLVYDYVIKYGVTDERTYPYTARDQRCRGNGGKYTISSYKGGALPNCAALSAMVTKKPVTVAVAAGNSYWQGYSGGIMNVCGNARGVDHGVTLVGVYEDEEKGYWKIKNSWGTRWGENGYIRLSKDVNRGNICNICLYGFYPEL